MNKQIKIIGINSSPRKSSGPAQQESSTRILLAHALKHISDRAKTDIIDLIDYEIKPSEGCYSTDENLNQFPCSHFEDDMTKFIFNEFEQAEGVIFSSPVYWLGISSRLAALFERLTEMDPIVRDPKQRLLQGKVAGAIATAHTDGSVNVCYEILKKANYLGFILPPHAFAIHNTGQLEFVLHNKESLKGDFLAFRNAEMVAENVYKMCSLVHGHNSKWSVFVELVHPPSEKEKKHIFDLAEEEKRFREDDFWKKNRLGLI